MANSNATKKNQKAETSKAKDNLNVDGLESAPATQEAAVLQFENREWLENNNPEDFHFGENISPKYEKESEASIKRGLDELAKLAEHGVKINPLMLLLGRWWEVKSARAEIRKMLAEEGEKKGQSKDVYLEVEIGQNQIDVLADMQAAIGRLRYARTFYKPRTGLSTKVITQDVKIDGKMYKVATADLLHAKTTWPDDKDAIKEYVLSVATEVEVTAIEEL